MSIIQDLVDNLKSDAPVSKVQLFERLTAVQSGQLGLAYRFKANGTIPSISLEKQSACTLARLALDSDPTLASIGMAAINSLLEIPEEVAVTVDKAFGMIAQKGVDRNVVVVGHFPFVSRLEPLVRNLWVLELECCEGDLPAFRAPEFIEKADVVVITGSTLVNHTLDDLLRIVGDRYTFLLGPSTPLSPILFDYGVDAICGSVVVEPAKVMTDLGDGLSFRRSRGLKPIILTRTRTDVL